MNFLKYKVFWWIWLPMGFLKIFSRVVLMTTLGKNIYMQISAAIIENRIRFHLVNCGMPWSGLLFWRFQLSRGITCWTRMPVISDWEVS